MRDVERFDTIREVTESRGVDRIGAVIVDPAEVGDYMPFTIVARVAALGGVVAP
jgi:hypothetical protein